MLAIDKLYEIGGNENGNFKCKKAKELTIDTEVKPCPFCGETEDIVVLKNIKPLSGIGGE